MTALPFGQLEKLNPRDYWPNESSDSHPGWPIQPTFNCLARQSAWSSR